MKTLLETDLALAHSIDPVQLLRKDKDFSKTHTVKDTDFSNTQTTWMTSKAVLNLKKNPESILPGTIWLH